jgi:reactive intermediate/imine deaminase
MAGDIQYFEPQGMAPAGGHYSHAVKHGDLVFLSGQLPFASDGTRLVDKDFATQVRQVLANLGTALHAVGGSVAELVQVRAYIVDINDWPLFDRLYSEWIGTYRPSRAVVPVPALHYGFRIEVEAVAAVSNTVGVGSNP